MTLEETVQPKDRPVRLGIQSFEGWERDEDVPVLNFLDSFDDRYILKQELWQEKIFPELEMFLLKLGDPRRPLTLDLAAHASIAFAAGWILEEKSGHDVRIPQRTGGEGEREWSRKEGRVPKGPLWLDRPDLELSPDAPDVALALAVTHPTVPEETEEYIRRKGLPVRRIINATIAPKAGQDSVKSGAHSLALAQDLLPRLRQRYPPERGGRLHLFCAAPNALLFYLGQISRSLGRMVLYEYALDHDDPYARYCPSIELPPPGRARKLPEGW